MSIFEEYEAFNNYFVFTLHQVNSAPYIFISFGIIEPILVTLKIEHR